MHDAVLGTSDRFFSLTSVYFFIFQPPKQKISDPDELQEYKLRKRKVNY